MCKYCHSFLLCHSHHTITCLPRLFAAYLSATHIWTKTVSAKQSAPLVSGTASCLTPLSRPPAGQVRVLEFLSAPPLSFPRPSLQQMPFYSLCSQKASWVEPLVSACLLPTPTPSSAKELLPSNPMEKKVSFLLTGDPLLFLTLLSSKILFIKFIEWSLCIKIYWSQLFELVEVLTILWGNDYGFALIVEDTEDQDNQATKIIQHQVTKQGF